MHALFDALQIAEVYTKDDILFDACIGRFDAKCFLPDF